MLTRVFVVTATDLNIIDKSPAPNFAYVVEWTLFAGRAGVLGIVGRVELHAYNEVVWDNTRHSNGEDNVA